MVKPQVEIQRAYDLRQKEKGLTRVCMYVPKDKKAELKELAREMVEQNATE